MSEEFDYFRDRSTSRLVDLVLQLGTDLHVTSHRLRAMEALLVRKGVLDAGELDGFVPNEEEGRLLDAQRDALLGRLVRILTEDGPAEHPLRDQWEAALAEKAG